MAITKNNIDTIMACRYCPMCRHVCSSELLSYKESDAPRGRALLLYNIYKGGKSYDKDTVESIYNCFLCGCCLSWCEGFDEGGYDIPELIKFAREDIVKKGLEPLEIKEMKESLVLNNNIYNVDKHKSFSSSIKEKEAEILYYLGPDINFKNTEIAEAVLGILKKFNVDHTVLKNEPNSGKILSLLGYSYEAKNKAENLYKRIKKTNCKIILTSDPLAYDAFKNNFPEFGLKLEPKIKIKHITEYLNDLRVNRKLEFKKTEKKITLVDSEYVGRFNSIFEAARELLKSISGSNFIEMRWNKMKMLATGEAAFYFNLKDIDTGKELGKKIYNMARDIDAEIIVTLSAVAKNNINNAISGSIEVVDIAEYFAKGL